MQFNSLLLLLSKPLILVGLGSFREPLANLTMLWLIWTNGWMESFCFSHSWLKDRNMPSSKRWITSIIPEPIQGLNVSSLTSPFCASLAQVFYSHSPDAERDEQKSNECADYCSVDGRGGQRQQVCWGEEAMQRKCLVSVSYKDESTWPEKPTGPFSNSTVWVCVGGSGMWGLCISKKDLEILKCSTISFFAWLSDPCF